MIKLLALLPLLITALLPDYGACRVYSFQADGAWFVWQNAPANPQNVQMTFWVQDLRTGAEFLTGADAPYWIDGDAYVWFDYSFQKSDYSIRSLTCIARYVDTTIETYNSGPWYLHHIRLPMIERR